MHTYEIAFSGQIAPGADAQQVRLGIQRLFNAGEPLLDQFFSGRRIVVKRGLDQATAEKYRQAFTRVGALVELVAEHGAADGQAAAPAAAADDSRHRPEPAVQAAAGASPAAVLEVAPRDEYMAAFAHVQAPDFGLAAVGADLLQDRAEVAVVDIDVSGISLAPAGSDLEQLPGAQPVTPPDISHLSIEQPD